MNRTTLLGTALSLLFLLGALLLFFNPGSREPKASSSSQVKNGSSTDSQSASTSPTVSAPSPTAPASGPTPPLSPSDPDTSPSAPRGPVEHTMAGRRSYDTGIRNDPRVQSGPGGKRVVREGYEIAAQLHSEDISEEEDLQLLEEILALYRLSFRENPVAGDNQMVMEALAGNNLQNLSVFPPDHPAMDAMGQLLDRWGTPYFFHALSGREMEIFSAGPDQKFNTADDLMISERGNFPLSGAETPELDPGVE